MKTCLLGTRVWRNSMCHAHDPTYKPDKDPAIRYCWVHREICDINGNRHSHAKYFSLFRKSPIDIGKRQEAKINTTKYYGVGGSVEEVDIPNLGEDGFHMLRTIEEAKQYKEDVLKSISVTLGPCLCSYQDFLEREYLKRSVLLKCEVNGFISGGVIPDSHKGSGTFSETWKYRKAIKEVDL